MGNYFSACCTASLNVSMLLLSAKFSGTGNLYNGVCKASIASASGGVVVNEAV